MDPVYIICARCDQHPHIYDHELRCQCSSMLRKDIGSKKLPPTWQVSIEALTPRQYEIPLLIAKGHSISEITSILTINKATIKNHLGTAKKKTGCKTSWELVARVAVHESQKSSVHPED